LAVSDRRDFGKQIDAGRRDDGAQLDDLRLPAGRQQHEQQRDARLLIDRVDRIELLQELANAIGRDR
jgi:hypothetical protein